MKKFLTVATFIAVLALASDSIAQQRIPPTLDQIREKKFLLRSLQEKNVELNGLLGHGKPVVIDLWASWCGPCRQEIPHLVQLSNQYGKDGLIVIGLTIEDPQEDRDEVKEFVKQFKMNYRVAFAPDELYSYFSGNTERFVIPQTFVFGADGKVIRHIVGYNETKGKEYLFAAVDKAIKESGVRSPESGVR
ncbi:MAG: TlpA family protein disulfide reductase [Blastocatellia bacterium]|nr:TlpA family protein disulfide reductase [Blastocatellia bacterium]